MGISLAWASITNKPKRTAVSFAGVTLALVLVFMQVGFYDAGYRSTTLIHDLFAFDIAIVSPQYSYIGVPGEFPRRRLYQCAAISGVAWARPLYVADAVWRNLDPSAEGSGTTQKEILLLAVNPMEAPFRLQNLALTAQKLKPDDTAIVDLKMQRGYGPVQIGTVAELQDRQIRVVETYRNGPGFASDAMAIVSDRTLSRVFSGYPLDNVSLGLVKVSSGVNVPDVARRLRDLLPGDVQVLERGQLETIDQHFFMDIKPIGIMFRSGVLLALIVGSVILYQVLASNVTGRLHEFAVVEAIGYGHRYAQRVVLCEAAIYSICGLILAAVFARVLYAVTALSTNLPMVMGWRRLLAVLAMSLCMCGLSGLLVLRKLARVDPVELFP